MSSAEITIAVAGGLLAAFTLGFFSHWLISRLSAAPESSADTLAAEILRLEAERDAVAAQAQEAAGAAAAMLRERDAELRAAMDGLANARAEIEALRG